MPARAEPGVAEGERGRAGHHHRARTDPADQRRGHAGHREDAEAEGEEGHARHRAVRSPGRSATYWTTRKNIDRFAPTTSAIATRAPTRRRLRTRCGCTIGCGCRASVRASSRSSAAPRTKPPTVRAEPQPCSGAPMRAQTRDTAPTVALAAPTRSKRPGRRAVSSTNAADEQQHDDAEGHVDEERPPPRPDVGEQAAQDEADGGAARGDRAEEGEGAVASRLVGRARGQQGEDARCGEGRADALERAGRDELARASGRARRARRRR